MKKNSFYAMLILVLVWQPIFGQATTDLKQLDIILDRVKYPEYTTISLEPLWITRIDDLQGLDNYTIILGDSIVVANHKFVLDIKTGKEFVVSRDIGKVIANARVVTSNSDSVFIFEPSTKEFFSLGGSDRIARAPQLIGERTFVFPTINGIACYDPIDHKKLWEIPQDFRITYDKLLVYRNETVASRTYNSSSTDSASYSVVKISSEKNISKPISLETRVSQFIVVKDKLALVCDKKILLVDLVNWHILSEFKLDRSQSFVALDHKLVSPNVDILLSTGEIIQTSKVEWSNGSIAIWNGWLLLNFDDGEVTRQFLVSSDRSRVFQLDYVAKAFEPCKIEGFVDRAILNFTASAEKYSTAVCKCDNGYFLYGFKFPDLPTN